MNFNRTRLSLANNKKLYLEIAEYIERGFNCEHNPFSSDLWENKTLKILMRRSIIFFQGNRSLDFKKSIEKYIRNVEKISLL